MNSLPSNETSVAQSDEGSNVVFGRTADGLLAARIGADDAFAMVPCSGGEYTVVSAWRLRRPTDEWKRSDFYIHFGLVSDEAAFRARVEEQAEHRRELKRLDRQTMASRDSTPWGTSEGATIHADGIVQHTTPGHGGFCLTPERNADVTASFRRNDGWYEEDCEWAIVALSFPEHFTAYERRCADETVRHSWPDEWEALLGRVLEPGESTVKDRRTFEHEHAGDWIVVSAIRSDQAPGMTEVIATRGGKRSSGSPERRFLVPSQEYGGSGGRFGFVIDEARHAPYDGPSSFVGWRERART